MDRQAALDWARAARRTRESVRSGLSSGSTTLRQLLDRAGSDELVGAVRLGWALESLPGARKVDTRRQLGHLGLDPARPLDSLSQIERAVVLEEFGTSDGPTEGVADEVPPLPDGTSVVVISGPGGVGKGTLVSKLIESDGSLWLSRSWTTRARRPGEAADAYHFASEEEFMERVAAGGFLEWTRFLDYLQGSPVPDPPPGSDVLFEIDVRGAANVERLYPGSLLVFVDAPDRATQEQRLRKRGDDEERVQQRLRKADDEVALASRMDFVHLVNDDLDRASEELRALIAAHRSR
jgi:guanylate kinase